MLSIVITSLIISYMSAMARLKKLEDNEEELYKKTLEEEKKIAEKAQTEFISTIATADEKAQQIVSQAAQVTADTQKVLNQALVDVSEKEKQAISQQAAEFLKNYQKELQDINVSTLNTLKGLTGEIVKEIESGLAELKKTVSEETYGSHKVAEEKIKAEYETLEKELKGYKEEQLKRINDNMYQILLSVSKEILAKSINFEQHEDLIMQALEKAKSETTFEPPTT